MKTVEDAHRAGTRDGKAGLGPTPPRGGPPGSLAQRIRDAYLQSYRDESVARKRERNRRRPCVRQVKRRPARKRKRAVRRRRGTFARMGAGRWSGYWLAGWSAKDRAPRGTRQRQRAKRFENAGAFKRWWVKQPGSRAYGRVKVILSEV